MIKFFKLKEFKAIICPKIVDFNLKKKGVICLCLLIIYL